MKVQDAASFLFFMSVLKKGEEEMEDYFLPFSIKNKLLFSLFITV